MKVPQLSALMSPGPAATDNNTGAKDAWQALVLLFLGVAAATLNGGVGAKGASVLSGCSFLTLHTRVLSPARTPQDPTRHR